MFSFFGCNKTFLYNLRNLRRSRQTPEKHIELIIVVCFLLFSPNFSITASVSVRNIRNIPKVPLTVKPDPNDTLNRSLNGGPGSNANNFYYNGVSYAKPADELYMNGQAQQQGVTIHQDPLQHQYAVVKKTGSKRDVRENAERENSAMFKVSSDRSGSSERF